MSSSLLRIFPANPVTIQGQSTKIGVDPKGERIVYTNGRTVIIRSIDDPTSVILYAQHAQPCTVARISPSGYYCASADVSGTVRIWDLVGTDQVLKSEFKVLSGRINDLEWDGESKRIIAVGDGREKFGHAFLFDSGSSCGEILGHSKPLNSVALRPQRPFRAATAGDDNAVVFFTGVPYKLIAAQDENAVINANMAHMLFGTLQYNKTLTPHSRFVHSVAYSPKGTYFASAGSDGKLILFDGSSGDIITTLVSGAGDTAHSGTIFSISFSQDGAQIISAGADGFVHVWDVETKSLHGTWDLKGSSVTATGDRFEDQLVGAAFVRQQSAVILNRAGEIAIIDLKEPGSLPKNRLYGLYKGVVPFGITSASEASVVAGSYDGLAVECNTSTGIAIPISGPRFSKAIAYITRAERDVALGIDMGGSVRAISQGKYGPSLLSVSDQPKALAASTTGGKNIVFVATISCVEIYQGNTPIQKVTQYTPPSPSTAIACNPKGDIFAVATENKVIILVLENGESRQVKSIDRPNATITALSFSPDGSLLALGESNGKIMVYDTQTANLRFSQWVFHTARINSLEFSPDGRHAVSGSLDTNVYVWSTAKPTRNIGIKNVHAGGVTGACWLDSSTIATAGADGCVKTHHIQHIE